MSQSQADFSSLPKGVHPKSTHAFNSDGDVEFRGPLEMFQLMDIDRIFQPTQSVLRANLRPSFLIDEGSIATEERWPPYLKVHIGDTVLDGEG
jgi:hypothetical protein